MKILTNKQLRLINTLFEVCKYKMWDNKIGDKKAQDIIDKWHARAENHGIMAMAIDLQEKIGGKI